MNDRNRNALQQPQGNEPLLSVGKPIVLVGERQTFKDASRINEVEAVVSKVGATLGFVPRETHLQSVYTARKSRKAGNAAAR